MPERSSLPLRLYLSLLIHPAPDVRRQTSLILRCSYGPGVIKHLRGMLKSPEPELREQVRLALQTMSEYDSIAPVEPEHCATKAGEGLVVKCLGSLRVEINGAPIQASDWAQADGGRAGVQKVRAAFAYLIHCGRRGTSREALDAAVWGGEASPASIARTLTTLRQALATFAGEDLAERLLTITDERCLLSPETYQSDVALFEQSFELALETENQQGLAAAAPLYAQALDFYGGPYLADIVRGSGWMQERRETLAGSFIIASERLAEQLYVGQRYEECIRRCQIVLEDDMAADEIVVWLLRAYAKLGRNVEVEHTYRRYLRTMQLDPQSREAIDDPVIYMYHNLAQPQR
jgi:DNA-binding SARP family transcriptional activator